jgi:hypothetical protein
MGTALVFRGSQGVGKTIVGQYFGSLFGVHYKLVSDPRYITDNFNSHMASLIFLQAEEAFWAGDKRAEGKLKDLITGYHHFLEFKRIDPIIVKNFIRLFVSSNADWVVPAGFDERRFAIFDVGEAHMQDHDYFAAIDAEMKNGGSEALLHYLMNLDISNINLRKIPRTEALYEQIIESATSEQAWWLDTLQRGVLPRGISEANTCPTRILFARYIHHANAQGSRHKAIEVKIGLFLNKYVGSDLKKSEKTYHVYGRRREDDYDEVGRIYEFLKECRNRFAEKMGYTIKWDNDAADWTHERDESSEMCVPD